MLPPEATLQILRDHLVGGSLTGTGDVRYFLRELIGEGGQGWVYKANYDEPDGMWVVVKLLRPDSVHQEALVRFRREAEVLRMIGTQATPSPNVVRFYDHGITHFTVEPLGDEPVELPFTVLEYVDGITLADVVDASPNQGLAVSRVRRLLRQVVRALECVHAHRVVHRDLKPSNILIMDQSGREVVKVTDFGLVKLVDLKLTQTVAIAGATLGYAPPEQYEHGNERVSERTDVFSLAAILFECLTGSAAFPYKDGENPLRVITRILSGPRPSLACVAGSLSPELCQQGDLVNQLDLVLAKALQADPDQRHSSCRTFWSEVEPVLRAAEGRAVESGMLPAGADGSLPGVSIEHLSRVRAPLAGTDATTMEGPNVLANISVKPPTPPDEPMLRILSGSLHDVSMRGALFGGDGSIFAIGSAGLYRWLERSWSVLPIPSGLEPHWVRGIMRTPDGKSVLFGDGGRFVTLEPNGSIQAWPLPRGDIRILDAWMDSPNEAYLVGERLSTGGGFTLRVAHGREAEAQLIETPTVMRGIARMVGGALVACGDGGALVQVQFPVHYPIHWERTGHLCAIVCKPAGGLSIVGTGGHALYVSPSLNVLLEPVQTTRDLIAVTAATDGAMWAVGVDGRVLRHDGTTWIRVSPSVAVPSRLIGVGATARGVVALGEDGMVVEAGL